MLELSLTTKFIIVALVLLAAGLYYVYNSNQKFKTAIVNVLNNIQSEQHQTEVDKQSQLTEPEQELEPENPAEE